MKDDVHPHSVRIRVPMLGLSQRQELEEAARAIGAYSTTDETTNGAEWVRFDFGQEHAPIFRREAVEIVGDLVEDAPHPRVTHAA